MIDMIYSVLCLYYCLLHEIKLTNLNRGNIFTNLSIQHVQAQSLRGEKLMKGDLIEVIPFK